MANAVFPPGSSGSDSAVADIDFPELARMDQAVSHLDRQTVRLLAEVPTCPASSRVEKKRISELCTEHIRIIEEGRDLIRSIEQQAQAACFPGLLTIVRDELYPNVAHNPIMPAVRYCEGLWSRLETSESAVSRLAVFRGCRSTWQAREFRPSIAKLAEAIRDEQNGIRGIAKRLSVLEQRWRQCT